MNTQKMVTSSMNTRDCKFNGYNNYNNYYNSCNNYQTIYEMRETPGYTVTDVEVFIESNTEFLNKESS